MEWYSWLSKSSLDPSLVYEYSMVLSRNELQKEDLAYFNHEFLQSMGILVAKHRLEILKLARKEVNGSRQPRLWKFIWAIGKTKKCFTGTIGRAFRKEPTHITANDLTPYRTQWTGALRKHESLTECRQEKVMVMNRATIRSGPLDRRLQERLMVTSRSLSLSGPLDGKGQEKLVFGYRSPMVSGPLDGRTLSPEVKGHYRRERMDSGDGVPSLWSLMFQDMKPT